MEKPKVAAKRVIFESKRFRIVEKDMEFHGGEKETWEIVEHKGVGAARVIAMSDKEELVFIREYRGATENYSLRFPTGWMEEGEIPEAAAQRELKEETGIVADTIEQIGIIDPPSGYYKGTPVYLFFATGLTFTGKTVREPGERDMEVLNISLDKAYEMLDDVEFEAPDTAYAFLLLKKYLRNKA